MFRPVEAAEHSGFTVLAESGGVNVGGDYYWPTLVGENGADQAAVDYALGRAEHPRHPTAEAAGLRRVDSLAWKIAEAKEAVR